MVYLNRDTPVTMLVVKTKQTVRQSVCTAVRLEFSSGNVRQQSKKL